MVEVGRGRGEGTEGFVGDLERERVEREEGAGFGIEDLPRPVLILVSSVEKGKNVVLFE